jgi:hypothetical protein
VFAQLKPNFGALARSNYAERGQEVRDQILVERAGHAVVMLNGILGGDAFIDVPWSARYLRARLAEHPAEGYKTWDERMAELERARQASPGGAR